MTTVHVDPGSLPRAREASAFALLVATIRECQGGDESIHKRRFRSLLKEPGYEDFVDALITEWLSIKYSTAAQVANPPTAEQLRDRRKRQREESKAAEEVKMKIIGRALDMITPNGKKLSACNGAECVAFGGWYARIGAAVGPTRTVGEVLTNEELARL